MESWLNQNIGDPVGGLSIWWRLGIVALIVVFAYFVDLLFEKVIIPAVKRMTERTAAKWDDILLSERVCNAFSNILPPVILSLALPLVLGGALQLLVARVFAVYIIFSVARFLHVFIGSIHDVFAHRDAVHAGTMKGIWQTLQILMWFVAIILMFSAMFDKNPIYFISGLGAAAAVLMLVFQDSIKGLVAGIQLSFNDMLRPGDWIVMSGRHINGVVTDVTLTTVKVRNWDNTILTVQPYALITETFQNWRGMAEGGGRRVTRAVNIDMHTIRMLDDGRTNLEAFRHDMLAILRRDPRINSAMTLMVRQLDPTPQGLPIELYCFTHTKVWTEYEDVMASLVERMIATLPAYDLAVYQRDSDATKN